MKELKEIIIYLVTIIDIFAAVRVLYCIIKISINPDEQKGYTKKIINILIFVIISVMVFPLKNLMEIYFR